MTSDTQKARELLDAAYTFLDGKIASDSRYREAFKAGCCAPFEADRLTEFAAHVTAQKDAEIAKAKHLASAFGETITNIAVKVLGLSDPNLPGDGADWDSDKTFSESVIESFAALRAQAEKDKAEIAEMRYELEDVRKAWHDQIKHTDFVRAEYQARLEHSLDPIVRAKMLEPPPPIIIESATILHRAEAAEQRVAKLEEALRGQSGRVTPTVIGKEAFETASVIDAEVSTHLAEHGIGEHDDKK